MERNTRTPVIDGGIVHAPPNTTATYDFAENSPHSQSNTGATGPITHGERTANTMKYGPGSRGVVESGGVGPAAQSNDYYTGNAADTSGATDPRVTSDPRPTSSKIKESASGVKGLVAAAHGTGEMVRGNINAGIDRVLNDKAGEAHNNVIAARGEHEINTGQFSNETKNREGVIPGADGDKRKNRDFLP